MGLSARQYRDQMQALLPSGAAWPRDDDAQLTITLDALAEEYARIGARAAAMIAEFIPSTTTEMITEWERVLALPDPCVGVLEETLAKRRAAVVAKLNGGGSASKAYYIALAAALGYTVTITEPSLHTWQINAPATTVTYLDCGSGASGDRLASWGDDFFECFFQAIKPAHTILNITYS